MAASHTLTHWSEQCVYNKPLCLYVSRWDVLCFFSKLQTLLLFLTLRSPNAGPVHLFHPAGTRPRLCTEASVQVSPAWQSPASSTRMRLFCEPGFAKSGWVRAACGNSCSGSDQKQQRSFFDCYLFVRLPLKLSHLLKPPSLPLSLTHSLSSDLEYMPIKKPFPAATLHRTIIFTHPATFPNSVSGGCN